MFPVREIVLSVVWNLITISIANQRDYAIILTKKIKMQRLMVYIKLIIDIFVLWKGDLSNKLYYFKNILTIIVQYDKNKTIDIRTSDVLEKGEKMV